jgi:hypothetical protein
LVAIALVARNPSRLAGSTLLDQAHSLIQQILPGRLDATDSAAAEEPQEPWHSEAPQTWRLAPGPAGPASRRKPEVAEAVGTPAQRGDDPLAPAPAPEAGTPEANGADQPGVGAEPSLQPAIDPAPLVWSDLPPVNTAFAGFPFLIPLLSQLGIEAWLDNHPLLLEWDWPRHLLLRIAAQLGIPPEDPVLTALVPDGLEPGPQAVVLHSLSRHWSRSLRRWSLGQGRLSLAALVRRPGSVVCHRTHLDLYFDHRQAEIRVRRLGLDLDPGWVSWLGLVVQFHYLSGGGSDGG